MNKLNRLFVVQIAMVRIVVGVITVFAAIGTVSQLALHDHKSRKMLVGTSGMIVTVVMYASPLSIVVSIFDGIVTFSNGIYKVLI